jgi:predicted amino acid-binding ACT domain protein
VFAITTERRLSHPAIVAISQAARDEVFSNPAAVSIADDQTESSELATPVRSPRMRSRSTKGSA